jgi:hypothetical protein
MQGEWEKTEGDVGWELDVDWLLSRSWSCMGVRRNTWKDEATLWSTKTAWQSFCEGLSSSMNTLRISQVFQATCLATCKATNSTSASTVLVKVFTWKPLKSTHFKSDCWVQRFWLRKTNHQSFIVSSYLRLQEANTEVLHCWMIFICQSTSKLEKLLRRRFGFIFFQ